jgi:hypothetical protein
MSRLKWLLLLSVFNAVGMALIFVAAEILLAVAGVHPYSGDTRLRVFDQHEVAVADALDGVYAGLGARARKIRGTKLWTYVPVRSEHYNANSLGFRGPEPSPRADPNELRIAVLGGSTVWGSMVADRDTMPARLETVLRAALPSRNIHVYNLGIEGFALEQEIALAERLHDAVDPDALVFYDFFNDARLAYQGNFELPVFDRDEGTYLAQREGPLWQRLRNAKEWLAGNSRVYRVIERVVRGLRSHPLPDAVFEERLSRLVAGYRERIAAVTAHERARGIPVWAFVQPSIVTKQRSSEVEQGIYTEWIENYPGFDRFFVRGAQQAAAADDDLPIFDLSQLFAAVGEPLYWDCAHVDPDANQRIAEAIGRELAPRLPRI